MERVINNNRLEIAQQIILKAFTFLECEYFYTPVSKIEDSNSFIESLEVEYSNSVRRRDVAINYTKLEIDGDIKYTFSVSVTRIPYVGNEDLFSLSNYLQSLGEQSSNALLNNFDQTDAEVIVNNLARLLRGHASPIIEGLLWLETNYPRRD